MRFHRTTRSNSGKICRKEIPRRRSFEVNLIKFLDSIRLEPRGHRKRTEDLRITYSRLIFITQPDIGAIIRTHEDSFSSLQQEAEGPPAYIVLPTKLSSEGVRNTQQRLCSLKKLNTAQIETWHEVLRELNAMDKAIQKVW
jgi:hypothetical protein